MGYESFTMAKCNIVYFVVSNILHIKLSKLQATNIKRFNCFTPLAKNNKWHLFLLLMSRGHDFIAAIVPS
jgi:hypothetical protein